MRLRRTKGLAMLVLASALAGSIGVPAEAHDLVASTRVFDGEWSSYSSTYCPTTPAHTTSCSANADLTTRTLRASSSVATPHDGELPSAASASAYASLDAMDSVAPGVEEVEYHIVVDVSQLQSAVRPGTLNPLWSLTFEGDAVVWVVVRATDASGGCLDEACDSYGSRRIEAPATQAPGEIEFVLRAAVNRPSVGEQVAIGVSIDTWSWVGYLTEPSAGTAQSDVQAVVKSVTVREYR